MVTPLRVLRKGLNPQKETQCMLQLLPEVRILAARLEAEIRLIFRGDLSHLSLKGNLRIKNLVDFEKLPDFSERSSTWPVAMNFLYSFVIREICSLASSFVCQLLPGALEPVFLRAVCFVRAISILL